MDKVSGIYSSIGPRETIKLNMFSISLTQISQQRNFVFTYLHANEQQKNHQKEHMVSRQEPRNLIVPFIHLKES
jgi:hypothetical protein